MKTIKTILMSAFAAALLVGPITAEAHCGGCGSDHAKTAETSVKTKAIYPLAVDAGFKTLTAAIKAAGLEMTLTEKGPFTVFAPTDEAFAKLPEGTIESLLANPEALKKVLLHHVVSGIVMAKDVVMLESAETLNGTRISINAEHGVMIGESNVLETDIDASNGVVHVIDTVLIPDNL